MDQILIRDLSARGVLGIYEWERQKEQEVLINLTLFLDLRSAGRSDALGDTVDYQALAEQVQALVAKSTRQTVEALAEDIAQLCLGEAGVARVRVRVEKPKAVAFARSVGVEIERP